MFLILFMSFAYNLLAVLPKVIGRVLTSVSVVNSMVEGCVS